MVCYPREFQEIVEELGSLVDRVRKFELLLIRAQEWADNQKVGGSTAQGEAAHFRVQPGPGYPGI
ncbi:MAG: hypothetical protein HYS83_01765 [Candidatus Blackburnbacteria bacterium]|nr:hypothetical protein [Candidatus Blackburnbacteria bacterium]